MNRHEEQGAGQVQLHLKESGQPAGTGTPIVLLHGLFGDGDNLGALARELEATHHVVMMDLANHGLSPHRERMTLSLLAGDVIAALDRLQLAQADLVGHSLGGKVAMQLAMTHPQRVRRLVVADIAPVAYAPKLSHIMDALLAVDLDQVRRRSDADAQLARTLDERGVRQFLLKSLYRAEGGYRWRFNLPVLAACYDEISAAPVGEPFNGPTLFIKGEQSDYITAEYGEEMQRLFPQLQFRKIAGTGHWLHAEKPVAFNRLVVNFIDA